MFSERQKNVGIIFSGHHKPGQHIKRTVENGDRAVLRIGAESVQVEDVEIIGSGTLRAKIHGFEPSFALEHSGLEFGDVVTFEESSIFSCSSDQRS